MRVPDNLLQRSFMTSYNRSRRTLADIQLQLTTQSKVNRPSDNPLGNSRIMKMDGQLSTISTYLSNISYARSTLDDSILSMEGIETEIQNVQVQLTQLNSAIVNDDLSSFAGSIGSSIDILLELANSDFNGQYNFGGTETGTKPFSYDEANNRVVANSNNLGGERVVKISSGITQKFNVSGKELFQSVLSQSGNLDSTATIGSAQTTTSMVYDSEGNEYTINLTYTKTADNTYDLNYTITDSESNEIENENISDLIFDENSGNFKSVNGNTSGEIHIQNSDNKLDFILDFGSLTEKEETTSIRNSLNQKADIFNTLISIKEKLEAGEKPTAEQVELVNEFHQHVLNKLSLAGGISNKLSATENILHNQEIEVSGLLSLEKDVDVARALIELESAQYTLDVSYQISSMILPRSLLDYL